MALLSDEEVALPAGPRLAIRRADAGGRPFLLVHGLASNARMWDGVARRLAAAGHQVVAVDQRGHGRSEQTRTGYSTEQCAADLVALCEALGFTGDRAPVVAGQSWGGNVALMLAARYHGVAALALVDGGWIRLSDRFPTFERCWQALEPPRFDGMSMTDLVARISQSHPDWPAEGRAGSLANFVELSNGGIRTRLSRDHHRSILHSLWCGDPRRLYPLVSVPVLLATVVTGGPSDEPPEDSKAEARKRADVAEALALLPRGEVVEYVGAHHDLHAQHPDRLARDLLSLAARAEVPVAAAPAPSRQVADPPSPGATG